MAYISSKFTLESIEFEFDVPIPEPYDSGYLCSKGLMKSGTKHVILTKPIKGIRQ